MGHDITVKAQMVSTTSNKQIVFDKSARAYRFIYSSGGKNTDCMLDIFATISLKYPNEEFHVSTYSSGDIEKKEYFYSKLSNGRFTESASGENKPKWFADFQINKTKNYVDIISNESRNSIKVGGFKQNEMVIIAESVHHNIQHDYIRFSDTEVMYEDGSVILISSMPEEDQEYFFGIKPQIKNITHTLFWWCEESKEFKMHPELISQYENVERAIKAFNRGEYALWETKEGPKFFNNWREDYKNKKANIYSSFCRLGLEPIKGKEMDENELEKKAAVEFEKDATKYTDSFGHVRKFVDTNNRRNKLVMIDGNLQEVNFNVSDFYPLNFHVIKETVNKSRKPTHVYKISKDSWEVIDYSFTVIYNGEVIHTEVL